MGRFWFYAAAAAALFLLIALAIPAAYDLLPPPPLPPNVSVLDVNISEGVPLKLHIHPQLSIEIEGVNQTIPAGIGISENGLRVIHTHDDSGRIHVESPWPMRFYLKDFFYVWGKRFDSRCIFDYCSDGNHTLAVYVNGTRSGLYGDLPLEDGEQIRIVYS